MYGTSHAAVSHLHLFRCEEAAFWRLMLVSIMWDSSGFQGGICGIPGKLNDGDGA